MKAWSCIENCGACCKFDLKNRTSLRDKLSDEDIEFLKIHPDNDTLANFYSELLLILRFIRNKEAYTIGG